MIRGERKAQKSKNVRAWHQMALSKGYAYYRKVLPVSLYVLELPSNVGINNVETINSAFLLW